MKNIVLFIVGVALLGAIPKHEKQTVNWASMAGYTMRVALYTPETDVTDAQLYTRQVEQAIVQDGFYAAPANFDLLRPLGKIKGKTELKRLENVNAAINNLFSYKSNAFNYWYAEPPAVSMLLHWGDCKAYAYYKYWTLRQMGYKNVKLITVVLPTGTGDLAGHVVVLLNDLWVFDINPPYFYPFEYLRETTGLNEAFFPDGSVWSVE